MPSATHRRHQPDLFDLAAVDKEARMLCAPPVAAVVLDELRVVDEVVLVVILIVLRCAAGSRRLLGLRTACTPGLCTSHHQQTGELLHFDTRQQPFDELGTCDSCLANSTLAAPAAPSRPDSRPDSPPRFSSPSTSCSKGRLHHMIMHAKEETSKQEDQLIGMHSKHGRQAKPATLRSAPHAAHRRLAAVRSALRRGLAAAAVLAVVHLQVSGQWQQLHAINHSCRQMKGPQDAQYCHQMN